MTKILETAGYVRSADGTWMQPGGTPFALRMVVDEGDAWATATADLLVKQLEHNGIELTIIDAPSAMAAGSTLSTGGADLALISKTTSPFPSRTSAWYTPILGPAGEGARRTGRTTTTPP